VEDLFDSTRDKWQKSYRQPRYLRLLFLVGIAIVVAAVVFRARIRGIIENDPRVGWPVVGAIALMALACFWTSIRAWECKILISPTSIKAWYLFRGRERVSWDSMDRVVYKWRLLGHTLTVYGTDGARIRLRSSLRGYDEVIDFVRAKGPKHIADRIDELLGDEDAEDEELETAEPEGRDESSEDKPQESDDEDEGE